VDTKPPPDASAEEAEAVQAADERSSGATPPGRTPARRILTVLLIALAVWVVALLLLDSRSDGSDTATPSAAPNPSPTPTSTTTLEPPVLPPVAPVNLTAETQSLGIELTWETADDPAASDPAVYEISRNGESLTAVPYYEQSYLDHDVAPGMSYVYEIVAVDGDGVESSEPASVKTQTTSPPIAEARLSGRFDMVLKDTSHFGYTTFGDPPSAQRWTLAPTCAKGACAATLSVAGVPGSATQLKREGASYEGGYRSSSFVSCAGTPMATSVSIRFEVTRAAIVDGEWRATKIAGTMTHREAAQLGCVASGTDFTVTGTLAQG
jgi:hypothetical protein